MLRKFMQKIKKSISIVEWQRVGVGEKKNLLAAVPESGFKYFKFQNHGR